MDKKTFLQSVASGAGIVAGNVKKRIHDKKTYKQGLKNVKKGAEKEAEEIFMKTQKGLKGNPTHYPKVDNENHNDQGVLAGFTKKGRGEMYGKRAQNVEKQVKKVRIDEYKKNNKANK